jgi:murein DD-endopeptidase MepM/ murein hydrolase activator NlpD
VALFALGSIGSGTANAEKCFLVLECADPTPTPSPKPKPSTSSPKPKPKPSSKPSGSTRSPSKSGGGTVLRPTIGWVLDTVGTARNTRHLLELLQQVKGSAQPLTQGELQRGFGRFPVLGYVWYQNDYGAPRYVPYFSLHEGIDLFAVAGTPIQAVVDGVIAKMGTGSIGGIAIWLAGDDGITYYYGHMQGYAPGMKPGMRLRIGDVIGYVGSSGATHGTYPHLHFEMSPGGTGRTVSPKPVLDAWLKSAEVNAWDAYARIVEFNSLNRIGAARWQTVFDLMRQPAPAVQPMWPIALEPTASSLGLDLAFDQIAWSMDAGSFDTEQGFVSGVAAPRFGDLLQGSAFLTTLASASR